MKKYIISALVMSTFASAQEGGLKIPFNFENARVLPVGIRNVRLMQSNVEAVDKFDGSGNIVGVGNALNKTLTYKDFIEGKKDLQEAGILKGTLAAYGIGEDEIAGETTGMVNISVNAKVPVIAYGATKKLTVALAIPYIETEVKGAAGSIPSSSLDNFSKTVVQGQQTSQHKAYKVQSEFANAINKKLLDNNYKDFSESFGSSSGIGDVKLVAKYLYAGDAKLNSSLKVDVTAPTGRTLDVNKAVDVGTGDGQWDIGLGNAFEYDFNDNITFSAFAGVVFQLDKTDAKRIPEKSDSKITADIDSNTKIDLGDQYKLETALNFNFWNGFNVITGYSYQKKFEDKYTGNKFSQQRYDYLSIDTEQSLHVFQAGVGFSTIPLFRQKKFKAPLQTNLFYSSVLEGKNIVKTDVITAEFALFF